MHLSCTELNDNVNVSILGSAAYQSPGVPHSSSQKVQLTEIAEIARHFLGFFPVLGKVQFCRGVDLEKQLQLIAASEIHLSFILAYTQRRNKNMQKRK